MCIWVCLYVSVSAESKGEILFWPTVKSRLCILVGWFCTSNLLKRGRFCMCVQEVDSLGEFPVACTVLCPSYPYPGCMLDGFRWAKKWEVILLPRGAAHAFSQKWVRASGAGTNLWSLAPSVGLSLVSAGCCMSWVPWHQVNKEVWGGCWCSVPALLWQGASGPASEEGLWSHHQVLIQVRHDALCWMGPSGGLGPCTPCGGCWAGDPLTFHPSRPS